MNFEDRVALITGGTAGIGEATVRRLASLGAKTVFVGRDENDGQRIESELLRNGAEALFLKADVSHPDEVRRIISASVDIYGRLDYAFNNAGISGQIGLMTARLQLSRAGRPTGLRARRQAFRPKWVYRGPCWYSPAHPEWLSILR